MNMLSILTYNNTAGVLTAAIPVPRELDLSLPFGDWELKALLVVLFLMHILFVNLMVGGSVLAAFFEILGLTMPRFDSLARKIADTITVNKSLAVVLGVAPLLCINLVYTIQFYSANALTGFAWLSVIPLAILAFLVGYIHKYTWDRWTGPRKKLHIFTGGLTSLLFLFIPFIFLANINLMLFPDQWPAVNGFFSSLRIGNVFPRYFHFVTASVAITGLFLAGWLGRKSYPLEMYLPAFTRPSLRRLFYRVAFFATLAQLLFGPFLFFTLPTVGISRELMLLVMGAILLATAVLFILRAEIRASDIHIGRYYATAWIVLGVLALVMATARHAYREVSLRAHKELIAQETDRFNAIELATRMRIEAGMGAGGAVTAAVSGSDSAGKSAFRNCAACHAVDKVLAAPSLKEIFALYQSDPGGIVKWAKDPGKKRPEFPPMPAFAHLGDDKLELAAEYMLRMGAPANAEESETSGS